MDRTSVFVICALVNRLHALTQSCLSMLQVEACKRNMNTFAFVGDLEKSPEVTHRTKVCAPSPVYFALHLPAAVLGAVL